MKYLLFFMFFLASCAVVPIHPASRHVYVTTGCPRVRVERVNRIIRSDGTLWVVVRLNACGERMVFEKHGDTWKDVTWKLR